MNNCPYCSSPHSPTAKFCPSCGGKLQQSQHLPVGTVLDRKYRIEKVLGQGGFGITYKATHVTLGQVVAVKEYFPEGAVRQGTTVVTTLGGAPEFVAEGQRLATLQHPGIVRVQDILGENNTFYLVMEFVAGKSLKEVLEDKGQLSEAEALGYIQKAAEALEVVHQAGMLHQDIKPDNLMLSTDGRVVLIDFGASRHFLSDKTGNYTRVVTPGYGPLEQYGQQVKRGPYTDIYALGATLYTLLTGQPPLAAPDRVHDPSLPKLTCSKIVREALERAMEISYLKRPQSTREFLLQLSGVVSTTTTTPNQPAPPKTPAPQPPMPSATDITQTIANGGTYRLGKGKYTVRGPVVLGGNLELHGEGNDTLIELVLGDKTHGIHCPEGIKITLRDLKITAHGEAESAILVEGHYDFERITLEGNVNIKAGLRFRKQATGTLSKSYITKFLNGVVIEASATGRLIQNTVEGNSQGIRVAGNASPTLEGNICKGNQLCGIYYYGEAKGLAKGNSCEGNTLHGIYVGEKAAPTLEGNICKGNQSCGIYYYGEATGLAKGNTCEGNTKQGIYVSFKASPTLEGNICKGNQSCGIFFTDEAKGLAKGNTCEGNTLYGICVAGNASPTLEGNICKGNQNSGISYFGESKGLAKGNTCEGNTKNGICVEERASPTLEGNQCKGNKWSGIAYSDEATGLAKGNTCEGNTLYGIHVAGNASPTLEENISKRNRDSGISFWGQATGLCAGNICEQNSPHGISVGKAAKPSLRNNSCLDNSGSGIEYWEDATGACYGNRCEGNAANGIIVFQQASPTLEGNICTNNGEYGIIFKDFSHGTAIRNVCSGHPEFDIAIFDPAKATLKGNTGKTNKTKKWGWF